MKSLVQLYKTVFELYGFEVFILASEVKFDLLGQRSLGQKDAYLIQKVDKKGLMQISRMVLEL